MTIYPVPKPRAKPKRKRKPLCRGGRLSPKGKRLFRNREDKAFLDWIRSLPCAICLALRVRQTTPTEAEHFTNKSRGGYDRGDCYPTCGVHRELRHVTMGPRAMTRMLLARGFDERKLCKQLVTMYETERFPCP